MICALKHIRGIAAMPVVCHRTVRKIDLSGTGVTT
jgi:hypothetical protein